MVSRFECESTGFYDAIGAGRDLEFAVSEGISSAELKGAETPPIVVVKQS